MSNNQPEIKFVSKNWGFEKIIVNNERYCGKLLFFVKNKKCSLHYHGKKTETMYVQSGKIKILYCDDLEKIKTLDDRLKIEYCNTIILEKGDNFHIPIGRVHQIIAIEDTELFEFSTEDFIEDSYRLIKGN